MASSRSPAFSPAGRGISVQAHSIRARLNHPPGPPCTPHPPCSILKLLMRRTLATLLLIFAVAGTFAPMALAWSAPPPHACCVRAAHHCHDTISGDGLTLRSTGCCNQDCSRAVSSARWAHPQPTAAPRVKQDASSLALSSHSLLIAAEFSGSRSTRAPPAC